MGVRQSSSASSRPWYTSDTFLAQIQHALAWGLYLGIGKLLEQIRHAHAQRSKHFLLLGVCRAHSIYSAADMKDIRIATRYYRDVRDSVMQLRRSAAEDEEEFEIHLMVHQVCVNLKLPILEIIQAMYRKTDEALKAAGGVVGKERELGEILEVIWVDHNKRYSAMFNEGRDALFILLGAPDASGKRAIKDLGRNESSEPEDYTIIG